MRTRPFVVLVALFTGLATAVFWWQALNSQAQLREQVLLKSEQRSMHLADAMAGQVEAQLGMLDMSLKDLREHWLNNAPKRFDAVARDALATLPPGFVSHVTVTDAQGYLVYNSLGRKSGLYVGDRGYFTELRTGRDRMHVGPSVRSRLLGRWAFTVSRPILRHGRFDGVVNLVVESAYMAAKLAGLELSDQDVVSLFHRDGSVMARSRGNEASMGQRLPADRPFMAQAAVQRGTYRVPGAVDHAPRTYGWYRLPDTGLVVAIGLSDASVLEPLAPALRRNLLVTAVLSLLLLGFGAVIVRDQLRSARSQKALAASEARLRDAQQLARMGSWEYSLEKDQIVWSDEVYRIFEMDLAAMQPSYANFLASIHPEDRARVKRAYESSVREHKPYDEVFRLLLPSGRVKHVRDMGFNEYDGERPLRSLGTVQDVTEVRSAQLALQQLNGELESRVAERTSELAQLNRELEAFAYSVSHDLRTPLRSIHGFACVLAEDEAQNLSDAGRTHLQRIQDGSRRMGQLITDLLTLAHLSRAQMRHEPVNLSELALAVAGDLQRSDPDRPVDWHIDDGVQVMADPGLMRVVLQNLLGNAWKYTGQTVHPEVSLTLTKRKGGMVTFCVRDNGAGFDMAYAAQLFQPFRRLHAHHEFEGSGVGLATVSRVIRRHGGQVRGEGAVGEGAAFFISLPEVPVPSALTTW